MHFTADDYFFTDIHGCCPVFAHFDALMMMSLSFRLPNGKLHNPKMAASLVKITEPNLQYEEYILWKPSRKFLIFSKNFNSYLKEKLTKFVFDWKNIKAAFETLRLFYRLRLFY